MKIGDCVRRAELKPFEVDLLVPKLRSAKGVITEIAKKGYIVKWTWPNGETGLAIYKKDEIETCDGY